MSDIANWMALQGVERAWVGAKDPNGQDDIRWLDGEIMDPIFWLGQQPEHSNGDCIYFHAGETRFKMGNCDDPSQYYPLCRWYNP